MREGGINHTIAPASLRKDAAERPVASFVIPLFNASSNIERVLRAVRAAADPRSEIIVVDDASLDDSARRAQPLADRVVRRPCQGGAARARNDGARHARGRVLVFVDSDVIVTPEAVAGVLRLIADGADAAFGSYTPLPPPEYRNAATTFKNLIHHYTHRISSREASTFWSGFGAVRRDAFLAVRGFDPAVTASADIEDIHLGYRLRAAGYRIVLDPSLQVEHLKRYTVRGMVASDFWHRAIPWTRAMLELRTFRADLNLRHSSMISSAVSWSLLASVGAAAVIDPRIALVTIGLGIAWLVLNAPFLLYTRRVWSGRGACSSAVLLFLLYVYASVGAIAGIVAYALRHDRASIRNRLHLEIGEPVDGQPRLTVAVLAGDADDVPALRVLHGGADYELLVVAPTVPSSLPDGARHVTVAPGASRSEMSQAALDAAKCRSLALLEGVYVPDDGWLDRVRAATELPFVMVAGSFEPAGDIIADRAIHVARLWPWRSTLPASWLAYHPAHNAVLDTGAARAVGGFGPEGALLLRLSGLGARPVLFDPLMCVRRGRPPTLRELTTAQVGPARRNTASWTRYLDYSIGHRLFLAVLNPLRVLPRLPRRALQALREHRADTRFWLSTPLAFLSNACSVAGDVVGLLSPGPPAPPVRHADHAETLADLEPDEA